MKHCAGILPDDYPCHEEGTCKVGRKWYCDEHAEERNMIDEEEEWISASEANNNDE